MSIQPIDLQIILGQQSNVGKRQVLKEASLSSYQAVSITENEEKTKKIDHKINKQEETKEADKHANLNKKERRNNHREKNDSEKEKDTFKDYTGERIDKSPGYDSKLFDDGRGKKIDLSR